ncbi:MAG: hypothetical protein LBR22_00210 [Desulfovibrio sp.]|jgi:hypothetical protein|nr:hypothetical protein [Desulfovibrio sp.]
MTFLVATITIILIIALGIGIYAFFSYHTIHKSQANLLEDENNSAEIHGDHYGNFLKQFEDKYKVSLKEIIKSIEAPKKHNFWNVLISIDSTKKKGVLELLKSIFREPGKFGSFLQKQICHFTMWTSRHFIDPVISKHPLAFLGVGTSGIMIMDFKKISEEYWVMGAITIGLIIFICALISIGSIFLKLKPAVVFDIGMATCFPQSWRKNILNCLITLLIIGFGVHYQKMESRSGSAVKDAYQYIKEQLSDIRDELDVVDKNINILAVNTEKLSQAIRAGNIDYAKRLIGEYHLDPNLEYLTDDSGVERYIGPAFSILHDDIPNQLELLTLLDNSIKDSTSNLEHLSISNKEYKIDSARRDYKDWKYYADYVVKNYPEYTFGPVILYDVPETIDGLAKSAPRRIQGLPKPSYTLWELAILTNQFGTLHNLVKCCVPKGIVINYLKKQIQDIDNNAQKVLYEDSDCITEVPQEIHALRDSLAKQNYKTKDNLKKLVYLEYKDMSDEMITENCKSSKDRYKYDWRVRRKRTLETELERLVSAPAEDAK